MRFVYKEYLQKRRFTSISTFSIETRVGADSNEGIQATNSVTIITVSNNETDANALEYRQHQYCLK